MPEPPQPVHGIVVVLPAADEAARTVDAFSSRSARPVAILTPNRTNDVYENRYEARLLVLGPSGRTGRLVDQTAVSTPATRNPRTLGGTARERNNHDTEGIWGHPTSSG
ncbi:hypothetical protein ADK53_22625 [Streptomyces sp. WM6373]|uniref:hypothetical protein n=1 Tax=Streptomyces sp. WM6373 TaxID=1415556 RepID=UPI0006AF666D|nr:hypothetical protein [Streptomyces sp. WM6373]KOU32250.1 hypothetical protein ADK53_22625 [Streptomyces sp. WM6373]